MNRTIRYGLIALCMLGGSQAVHAGERSSERAAFSRNDASAQRRTAKSSLVRSRAATDRLMAAKTLWMTIKDLPVPQLVEQFMARYPDSPYRQQAEKRLKKLRDKNTQSKARLAEALLAESRRQEHTDTSTSTALARVGTAARDPQSRRRNRPNPIRAIQVELRRIGCHKGSVSGYFDPPTEVSLRRFVARAGVQLELSTLMQMRRRTNHVQSGNGLLFDVVLPMIREHSDPVCSAQKRRVKLDKSQVVRKRRLSRKKIAKRIRRTASRRAVTRKRKSSRTRRVVKRRKTVRRSRVAQRRKTVRRRSDQSSRWKPFNQISSSSDSGGGGDGGGGDGGGSW